MTLSDDDSIPIQELSELIENYPKNLRYLACNVLTFWRYVDALKKIGFKDKRVDHSELVRKAEAAPPGSGAAAIIESKEVPNGLLIGFDDKMEFCGAWRV